ARFLSSLAVERNVSASTQNQALSAVLFLYREVLGQELPWLDDVVHAKRAVRLPVVLTRDEVRSVIRSLRGTTRLMAILLYGAGQRLLEAARLRVKDVDFARKRSSFGRARATRTARRPCRRSLPLISPHISCSSDVNTTAIWRTGRAGSSCHGRWRGSIPTPDASGAGNGSFPPRGSTSIRPLASAAVTIYTSPCCSGRSRRPFSVRALTSAPPATPYDTRSPRTCWRPAGTFGRCRNCSDIGMSRPRRSILTS